MLRLQKMTRDDWAKQADDSIEDILLDHAHCEKKAASMDPQTNQLKWKKRC